MIPNRQRRDGVADAMAHYPLVRCRDHALAPAYLTCVHVLHQGVPITYREEPDEDPGVALCAACDLDESGRLDDLRMVCVSCLRQAEGAAHHGH